MKILQLTCSALAVAALSVCTPPALGDATFTIRGAGFGHGVGMSQYGAYGFARKGIPYRQILGHYYRGTSIGVVGGGRRVRVLLATGSGQRSFSGATRAGGRRVRSNRSYGVRANANGTLTLLSPSGRRLKTARSPLVVSGGIVQLRGRAIGGRLNARYRGTLEFRANGRNVDAINSVALEHYVRGVVPLESPAIWPADALRAQAVAARTYAITSSKGGRGWEHYPDTRSQVYGGVAAERATTNAATAATRGQVVTYRGTPVTTYFFSTSGGRTENVENTSLGSRPLAWLRSVEDPYDDVSPKHRWGPIRMSMATADRRLGSLVKGGFEGIEVTQRGASPRIVSAAVVGSRGRATTTGAELRKRLGLFDTWAYFTTVASRSARPSAALARRGLPLAAAAAELDSVEQLSRRAIGRLTGRVIGASRRATVRIERRTAGDGWSAAGVTQLSEGGRYEHPIVTPGRYRARVGQAAGPAIRFRRR